MSLLRIGTKVRTIDQGARVHGRSPDKPEAIGIIQDHHRPFGRQSKDRTPPYYVVFETGESAWYDADEVEKLSTSRTVPKHATRTIQEGKIRKGTLGRIVNIDNDQRAAFFDGARVRVQQRLYFPDEVIVELLDDAPGGRQGTIGNLPLRYFVRNQGRRLDKELRASRMTAKAAPQHAKKKPTAPLPDYDPSTGEGQKRLMYESAGFEHVPPQRIEATTADYGADPLGLDESGVFRWRMVPSGDIVDEAERNRRLPRRIKQSHALRKAHTKTQLDRDIAEALTEDGQPRLATLFADPQARKTFAQEMRHEVQKRSLSQASEAYRAARPFTVKRLVQMGDRKIRDIVGNYARETDARAKADQSGGWVETRDGCVIYGSAQEP